MVGFGHGVGLFGFVPWIGLLGMVLFWLAVIVLVIWVVRAVISSPHAPSSRSEEDSALRILRERYARGEIDTDEYERMRQVLRSEWRSNA